MHTVDRAILNTLQRGFPICDRPFLDVAQTLAISEDELIARLERMLSERTLSRFGPMYHAERMGGALSLVAMAVPEARFDEVSAIVNGFDEVAHNYRRDHDLNMWFVVATERPDALPQTLDAIERETGLPTYNMPKQREFYVGLHFQV
jgi:DNA-binding Lrp family transcriptional regulator